MLTCLSLPSDQHSSIILCFIPGKLYVFLPLCFFWQLSLTSTNGKQSCKNCITHVRITYLIRQHQKAEKKQPHILQSNQSKAKERTSCSVLMSGESGGSRNGTIPLYSESLLERGILEARNQMLQDRRLLQTQPAAALPGAYVPQKQVTAVTCCINIVHLLFHCLF